MDTKFTTMSQQAIGDAIQSASAAGNPQLEPVHLLASLLQQERGVAARRRDHDLLPRARRARAEHVLVCRSWPFPVAPTVRRSIRTAGRRR